MSDYDNLITQSIQADRAQSARVGFTTAADTNPDAYAEAQRVARRTGVPVDTALAMPQELKKQARIGEIDFDTMAATSPATAAILADVEKAKIAHDNVESMTAIEETMGFLKKTGRAGLSGLYGASAGVVGVAQAPFDLLAPMADPLAGTLLPENPLRRVAAGLSSYRKDIQATSDYYRPKGDGVLESGWYSGIGSLSRNLATLPLAFAPGGQGAALTGMVAPVFGEEFGKARDKGIAPVQAATYGASQAAVEYATEKLPVSWLVRDLKAGAGFGKTIINQMAAEIPGEQVATVLQDLNEWATINPDKPFADYLRERPSAAAQTLIATVVGTGGQISVMKGAELAVNIATGKADQAQQGADIIGRLNDLAKADKVLQRSPETFEQFIAQAAEGGPVQQVFIDAQTLMQSGVAEQLAAVSPAVAEQLQEAVATGGQIAIPVEEYAARIAPTEYAQSLVDHLKVDPEGFSRAEAQEYMQSQSGELQAEVERAIAEQQNDDAFKASAEVVRSGIKQQLDTAARFTPQVNDAYAAMVGNFYAVQAARLGTTPEELFARYPLKVAAENVAGGQEFAQGETLSDVLQKWDSDGISHDVSEKKGVITLGKIVVPESGRKSGKGTAAMQSLIEYADRTGQRIELGASSQLGGDKARLVEFYERFGFKRNPRSAPVNKPFKDTAMVREPQQLNQSAIPNTIEVDGKTRPTTNSNGKPIAQTEEGLRNFWRWFGESKVVDAEGRPLVVYHGTNKDFTSFDTVKLGSATGAKSAKKAFFFSDSPRTATAYASAVFDNDIPDKTRKDFYSGLEKETKRIKARLLSAIKIPDGLTYIDRRLDRALASELIGEFDGVAAERIYNGDSLRDIASKDYGFNPTTYSDEKNYELIAEEIAVQFASLHEQNNIGLSGLIMPVYLKIDKLSKTDASGVYNNIVFDRANRTLNRIKRNSNSGLVIYNVKDGGAESNHYAVFSPTQIKSATGNRGTFDPNDANILNQSAFHGSPHKFSKFSLDHIGTGEGAQAFGWGLYFAGKRDVAEWYRDNLSSRQGANASEQKFSGKTPMEWYQHWSDKADRAKDPTEFYDRMSMLENLELTWNPAAALSTARDEELSEVAIKWFEDTIANNFERPGATYEVEIPEDDTMLLWDKPLSEQSEKVRAALANNRAEIEKHLRTDLGMTLDDYLADNGDNFYVAMTNGLGGQEQASKFLNSLGISGIKYLDGTSRTGGDGSFNYVIFDDAAVEVLNTYYQDKAGNRGSFNPATLQITLLKNADLSTFLHESGHAFLEMQFDMAERIAGLEGRTEGEQQLLDDTAAVLKWFGIRDLAEWNGLDFEEKRSHHEKFARGFEAYLFEGKAPSIEMQGLFQRFRAWMVSVYRELKALNVELTDEVRGVFDRMLASTDEIKLAEQGRSMMPLFTSPEQAGMTPEEFAAYQALGVDATNEAIEDLQSRGLRDMQWLRNARGRVVKQLQKEAKEQRAAVEMDVRREVMSQPIYQAWRFLTAKLTADDKIAPLTPTRADPPGELDETLDSLFVAIGKLGGLNKDEVTGAWGIDPADKPSSGVFGKPLWRREGGLSIDGMAEALAQYGYLDLDENGKWDIRDLEEKFKAELGGDPIYSNAYDYASQQMRPGDQVSNLEGLGAGRLDIGALPELGLPVELINHLKALRMTAKNGLHHDLVAEMFGFSSGDELVRRLAAANTPKDEIESLTDLRMLEQFGDLASNEAIERAADKAIHNDARARMIATEANALAKATGQRKVLASAAKEYARALIDRLKVRSIKPGQYASAEARAARAAEKASKAGDVATAAAEKRNQLIQSYATRAAYDAQDAINAGLRYMKKFDGDIKGLDADYADQIAQLLERFDLRKGQSLKAIDKRAALADWIKAQREAGLEPDIPPALENEAFRKSYKDMTVEEFRGLIDTVKQIEHLGRLKHKLLTVKDQREYEAVRDEIVASVRSNAQGRQADTRTPTTNMGRAISGLKRFWASHIKAATWARVMDGGQDGGPMWEYFIRTANERGDQETTMRAEATARLSEIISPVFKLGKMGGKGQFFPSIGRSLNREARIAIALNVGNDGNLQRLMGGEGWNEAQVVEILDTLSPTEWQAVQAVWDHFESYRPQIAAKERRVYGKEPEWVEPGSRVIARYGLRGGYYPIKYDPAASQRAEEHNDAEAAKRQLHGAYTSATTRRSFTKGRVEEVSGRPLLYTLAGLYSGVNDVIHDLAWHEWLIDANRLLRSKSIDSAIREHYGPEAKQQFKTWVQDVAEGEKGMDAAVDVALARLRQGVSAAGLGFNIMSALIQPLGITQSIVRVGAPWVARGVARYVSHPLDVTREVVGKSSFMENRARTRFRELNELRNRVQSSGVMANFDEFVGRYAYFMMMRCQQMVDVPTWVGAYEKAIAEGNDEERAISLADQSVIDAQGGGQTKDLSAIERGGPAQKLFTVFYSFMNTAMNLGVSQTMTADTPAKRAKLAADYLMLYTVPAVLGYFIKAAFTPGDSGDDDPEKIARKLLANQIDYLMGMMVVVREFGEVVKTITGANDMGRDYTGPAGLRLIADSVSLANQASQGEFDTAFRKAGVNVIGDLFGLPAAQVNRTWTGVEALADGETDNPAAIAFGFQRNR